MALLKEPICKWCCYLPWPDITLLSAVCILVLSHWPGRCRHRCWACTTVLQPSDSLHWCVQKLGRKDSWIYWSSQRGSDITYRISLFGAVCSQTFHQVITIILSSFSLPFLWRSWKCAVLVAESLVKSLLKMEIGNMIKHLKTEQWVEHWTASQDSWVLVSVLMWTCFETLNMLWDLWDPCLTGNSVSFFVKWRGWIWWFLKPLVLLQYSISLGRFSWCTRYFLAASICFEHCNCLTGFYLTNYCSSTPDGALKSSHNFSTTSIYSKRIACGPNDLVQPMVNRHQRQRDCHFFKKLASGI